MNRRAKAGPAPAPLPRPRRQRISELTDDAGDVAEEPESEIVFDPSELKDELAIPDFIAEREKLSDKPTLMVRMMTVRPTTIRGALDMVSGMAADVSANITSEGMMLSGFDKSGASFFHLALGFDQTFCAQPQQISFHLPTLCNMLKAAQAGFFITFEMYSDRDLTLDVIVESDKDGYHQTSTLKLWNLNQEQYSPFQDIDSNLNIITMLPGDFQKMCKDLTWIGNILEIECTPACVKFRVKGDISQSTIERRNDQKVKYSHVHNSKARYAIHYLNTFARMHQIDSSVRIYIQPEDNILMVNIALPYVGDFWGLVPDIIEEDDELELLVAKREGRAGEDGDECDNDENEMPSAKRGRVAL